jgi:hypothetical protein
VIQPVLLSLYDLGIAHDLLLLDQATASSIRRQAKRVPIT